MIHLLGTNLAEIESSLFSEARGRKQRKKPEKETRERNHRKKEFGLT
jgi:hypothetical protein